MKLHDLHPAEGSRQPRTRVGRGIAAGKGKTAGRGTKGQKARAGGSIPPWFEGGQTPLHMRIPKLRGFKNRFKIEYEVVNVGAIGALAERGAFEVEASGGKTAKSAPVTVNQDILRAVGLVRTLNKPLKILGAGDLSVPLFVVADAFTASARAKIEGAGGSVNVLEMPSKPLAALGVTPEGNGVTASTGATAKAPARRGAKLDEADATPAVAEASEAKSGARSAAPKASAGKAAKAAVAEPAAADEPEAATDEPEATAEPEAATDEPEATAEPEAATDEPEATAEPDADESSVAESAADEPPGDDA
jgi:large subunit ribosomal protein L15